MLACALLMLVVGGAADMASAAFRTSMLQSAADDAVRGRLQGVFIVVVAGGPRIADVLHGTAAAAVGTAAAAAGGGVLVVIGTVVAALLAPAFVRYRVTRLLCADNAPGLGTIRVSSLGSYDPDAPAGNFTGGPAAGYYMNLSAVLEPDVDGDGYGDVSQDLCPQSKLSQAACPAPDTTVTKAPKKKSTKRKATVKFSATVAGSTFTCAVDGKAAKPCTSPFKKKYKYGKHTVVITATSPAGIVDPTPVTVKFKVKRPPS